MMLRFCLAAAVIIILLPGGQSVGVTCAESCHFYGNSIISCESVVWDDIQTCYKQHIDATVLDLGFTDIKHISAHLFEGLTRIKHIYLDHVHLDSVDADSLSGLDNLQSLSLRGVGSGIIRQFMKAITKCDTLLSVNLGSNYRNCSCEWLDLVAQLTALHVEIQDLADTPQCNYTTAAAACNTSTPSVPKEDATGKQKDVKKKRDTGASWMYSTPMTVGEITITVLVCVILIYLCYKKRMKRRGGVCDDIVEPPQRMYGEKNEKIIEKDRFGAIQKALHINRKESTQRKMRSKSNDLEEEQINEEIRKEFLEKMAIRKSFLSHSDSDDAEADDDDEDIANDDRITEIVIDPVTREIHSPLPTVPDVHGDDNTAEADEKTPLLTQKTSRDSMKSTEDTSSIKSEIPKDDKTDDQSQVDMPQSPPGDVSSSSDDDDCNDIELVNTSSHNNTASTTPCSDTPANTSDTTSAHPSNTSASGASVKGSSSNQIQNTKSIELMRLLLDWYDD